LALFGSRSPLSGNDHRTPIQVLLGQQPQDRLRQWLLTMEPNQFVDTVVIGPVGDLPDAWPASLRVIQTTNDELSQPEGCLCCAMSTQVSEALRNLFFSVLRKEQPPARLVVLVTAANSVAPLALALKHAPFLGQRYRLVSSDFAGELD